MGESSSQSSSNENPLCPLARAIKHRLRFTGCHACIHLLGTVDNIKGMALDFRVPCAYYCKRVCETKVQLHCLEKGPTLESSVRFSLP